MSKKGTVFAKVKYHNYLTTFINLKNSHYTAKTGFDKLILSDVQ